MLWQGLCFCFILQQPDLFYNQDCSWSPVQVGAAGQPLASACKLKVLDLHVSDSAVLEHGQVGSCADWGSWAASGASCS